MQWFQFANLKLPHFILKGDLTDSTGFSLGGRLVGGFKNRLLLKNNRLLLKNNRLLFLYCFLTAFFLKMWVRSPQIHTTGIFYAQKPYKHGIFFIGYCEFFVDFRISIA